MKVKYKPKKLLYLILLMVEILLILLKKYYTFIAILLILILSIEQIYRTRKNVFLFFMEIAIAYFNYSVIISKYIGSGNSIGSSVWYQLKYSSTMGIGLYCVLLFLTIIGLILKDEIGNIDKDIFYIQNSKNYKFVSLIICILTTLIVFDYIFFHLIITNRKIYEYCIIFFVLGFYFSKNYRFYRNWLFIVMIISFVSNSVGGGRVVTLQPLIAWYYINFFEKINCKKLMCIFFFGVVIMTVLGLYGDILISDGNFENFNFSYFYSIFSDKKFTNDTSIMAYWAGLTAIEITHYFSWKSRITNFLVFTTIRSVFGSTLYPSFKSPIIISHDYYLHYYGGYITSFFYFWLGFLGVFIIGLIIAKIFNLFVKLNNNSSELVKILCIYWLSTIPRWYLYEPSPIFRGTLLIIIVYFFIKTIFLNEKRFT